ncbi:hypothetical protein V6N11_047376 [Hibiscus sabdariffa]|uniref:Uncharacterized protein n=1 Tax=Hibiscus sabdariffa TaxID=183260 RepID=A0ABR1ZUS7_9ROSI
MPKVRLEAHPFQLVYLRKVAKGKEVETKMYRLKERHHRHIRSCNGLIIIYLLMMGIARLNEFLPLYIFIFWDSQGTLGLEFNEFQMLWQLWNRELAAVRF